MWQRLVFLTFALTIGVVELQLTGGLNKVDPNNAQYGELAQLSLNQYLKKSSAKQHYQVVKVTDASEQVVAGTNYYLEFLVSPTDCLLNSDGEPSSSNCQVVDSSNISSCKSTVFDQPWTQHREVTDVSCDIN